MIRLYRWQDVYKRQALCIPYLKKAYDCSNISDEWLKQLVALYQEQLSYGQEIVELTEIFFKQSITYNDEAKEVLAWETEAAVLSEFKRQLEMLEDWSVDGLAAAIKQVQVNTGTVSYTHLTIFITGNYDPRKALF